MLESAQPAPGEGEETARLRALRDRALLFTLADTGLRVHEACNLRRGDLDWNEGRAVLIGKGDRQAVVRFSERSLRCLRQYLQPAQLMALPAGLRTALFARHDRCRARVPPISTTTARAIVRQRSALGNASGPSPHTRFATTL
jgi:site-specific recombinase XerD